MENMLAGQSTCMATSGILSKAPLCTSGRARSESRARAQGRCSCRKPREKSPITRKITCREVSSMNDDSLGALWGGICWIGGGLAFHLLKRYCGREIEALSNARKVKNIKELAAVADSRKKENKGIVVAVGKVNSDSPLACKNTRLPAAIIDESVEQFFLRQVNGNSWIKDSTYLVGAKRRTTWYLEDSTGRVHVEDPHQAFGLDLVVASDVIEEPSPSNTMRNMLDMAQGIRVLCVRRVERVLPLGSSLTVVGEVARNEDGKLVLRKPEHGGPFFISRKSLGFLVAGLGKSSSWCNLFSVTCAVFGAVSLVHFFLERRKASAQRRAQAGRMASRDRATAQGEGRDQSEGHCVICLESAYNIAFFPCAHVCCCKDCVNGLRECPLCRQRIHQKKFVFLH